MVDTGPHQFEMDAWISCAPFERLLEMTIVRADAGEAVLRMPFRLELAQGAGLMHGGALLSLADTAVVMAIKSVVEPRSHFATISMESRFLHPVKQGTITARARVVKKHGRHLHGEAVVYEEDEKEVLCFSSVFKIAKDAQIKNITFADVEDS